MLMEPFDLLDSPSHVFSATDAYSVLEFLEDMPIKPSWQPPTNHCNMWVFWIEDGDLYKCPQTQTHSSCSVPGTLTNHWSVKEKIKTALAKYERSFRNDILVQFWAPSTIGGRCLLTTSDMPFALNEFHRGLCSYRMESLSYKFNVETEREGELGLPGRVYRKRMPESTPDVRYYSVAEYPQREHAVGCGVLASFAFPVFEPLGRCCSGVLELVCTTDTLHDEIMKIYGALEVVMLKSSYMYYNPRETQIQSGLLHAMDEIKEALEVVCKTHQLPLAQTWVPSKHGSGVASGCNLERSCNTVDFGFTEEVVFTNFRASYFGMDINMRQFKNVCGLTHLVKGHGLVGKALLSHKPCFCRDITQINMIEYRLAHYARKYGLTGCFVICLRSTYTGNAEYVLEFFLPPYNTYRKDPRTLLGSLLATMKKHFKSFKVASGEELGEELSVELIRFSLNAGLDSFKICQKALQNEVEAVQPESTVYVVVVEDNIKNGMDADDSSESLGSNEYTSDRTCGEHDSFIGHSCSRDPSCPEPLPKQATDIVALPNVTPMPNGSHVSIKAKYRDNMIKFQLPVSSGYTELLENVNLRVQKIDAVRHFKIKYKDGDIDWILITCDDDLQLCMNSSRSVGNTTIEMWILPLEHD